MNANNGKPEQQFPAASPNILNKIPKPALIIVSSVLGLILLVGTFPHKKHAIVAAETAKTVPVDEFEARNPIKKEAFSGKSSQNIPQGSPIASNSASLAQGIDPVTGQPVDPSVQMSMQQQAPQGGRPASINSGNPVQDHGDDPIGRNSNHKPRYSESSSPSAPPAPYSTEMAKRLESGYQSMVQHFKQTSQQAVVAVKEDEYKNLMKGENKLNKIEPSLKNLTENSEKYTNKVSYSVASGTRIRAVTEQEVNSDHPGYFTAKITMPMELSGYTMLCQSKTNAKDRIPVVANKIIAPDGKKETQIPGEVQMKYAGLEGDIQSHYLKRLVPPIASAFIGAGAGYLYFKALGGNDLNGQAGRINSADQVAAPPFQQGVSGVQNEVERFGGDFPNTVTVPEGTQFDLLVTEPFSIEL